VITALPKFVKINGKKKRSFANVNNMTVSRDHLKQGLAQLMMEEMKRRLYNNKIHQSMFVAAVPLATPVCQT
jgi:hypothetical protein